MSYFLVRSHFMYPPSDLSSHHKFCFSKKEPILPKEKPRSSPISTPVRPLSISSGPL